MRKKDCVHEYKEKTKLNDQTIPPTRTYVCKKCRDVREVRQYTPVPKTFSKKELDKVGYKIMAKIEI